MEWIKLIKLCWTLEWYCHYLLVLLLAFIQRLNKLGGRNYQGSNISLYSTTQAWQVSHDKFGVLMNVLKVVKIVRDIGIGSYRL